MENFVEEDFDLARARELYRNGDKIQILLATCVKNNRQYVIKRIKVNSTNEANVLLKESYAMMGINHKSIIKIHAGLLGGINGNFNYIIFVMDYYPDGDLANEIKRRQKAQSFWHPHELTAIFKELVTGFEFMQCRGIAHRDIKPENILKNGNNYIISDLGCAFKAHDGKVFEIAGTQSYLSPRLRNAYITHHQGGIVDNFDHNAFKSDVFSLGLTFLYMASLKNIEELGLIDEGNYRNLLSYRLAELKYDATTKTMLGKMLEFNENERFNFLDLCTFCGIEGNQATAYVKQNPIIVNAPVQSMVNNARSQIPPPQPRNNGRGQISKPVIGSRVINQQRPNLGNNIRPHNFATYGVGYPNQMNHIPGHSNGAQSVIQNRPFSAVVNRRNKNPNYINNIICSESPGLINMPNNWQPQFPNCSICNEIVNDANFMNSPLCNGVIHTNCYNASLHYQYNEELVLLGYICYMCHSFHQVASKQLAKCDYCQIPTVFKLNRYCCLTCILELNSIVDIDISAFQVFQKLMTICKENYSSMNGICSNCNGIPDVLMNGNHWLCYQCIFTFMITNGSFSCNWGCCNFI